MEVFLHYALFISPYRCDDCYERHLRFRLGKNAPRPSAPRPRHAS